MVSGDAGHGARERNDEDVARGEGAAAAVGNNGPKASGEARDTAADQAGGAYAYFAEIAGHGNIDYTKPLSEVNLATGFRVEVWPYALGQYRIMLIQGDEDVAFPNVIRQMCTYSLLTAGLVVGKLMQAVDPVEFCKSLEKPWNCEYPGGRIRLDNTPEDRLVEMRLARSEGDTE